MKNATFPILILVSIMTLPLMAWANVHSHPIDISEPIPSIKNLDSLKKKSKSNVYKAPDIFEFQTKKGTKALFVNNSTVPMVDVSVTFNAGSARDADLTKKYKKKLQGVASLTAKMLAKGYKTKDKTLSENDIVTQLEHNGINFSSKAYKDMFVVSFRTLSSSKFVNKATDMMSNILSAPSFPQSSFVRVKQQQKIALQQASERPQVIASRAFNKALYGTHPYALPTSGSLESLDNITTEHLAVFQKKFLVAKNANIAITGNISYEEAINIANQITENLPKGVAAPALPKPKRVSGKHIHINFASNQTTFLAGQLGITRRDPKIHELMIANEILGGSNFSALLMRELRKKRGYTYGAYSGFTPMQVKGPFTISFATRADKAKPALKVFKRVVRNYLKKGATKQQVTQTKESLVNKFPLGLATNSRINHMLGMLGFYNLPKEYLEDYVINTMAPSTHAINVAFRKKINRKNLIIVTVGESKP